MAIDISRRVLLKAALISTAPALWGCQSTQGAKKAAKQPALIGGAKTAQQTYSVVVADQFGSPIYQLPLPSRGHGIAVSRQKQQAVVFSRRPGNYFLVIDYINGQILQYQPSSANRYFYGHGAFSADGKWLYVSEGVSDSSQGVVGVYDVSSDYKKVDEYSGFGVGPHELKVLSDGSLVVAVGGIKTVGRKPVNIDTMQPNLSYLSQTGQLIESVQLSNQQLSIRHLSSSQEIVIFAQQYVGKEQESSLPLLAGHSFGESVFEFKATEEEWSRFDNYIGSIVADEQYVLATSPRGNCYGIWSVKTHELVELAMLPDACGAAVIGNQFSISSGGGKVVVENVVDSRRAFASNIVWDNHWVHV
ncbi:DUF1513 domain-containing protein [Vibrio marisflavi]|nr:DUF1513 domain-containing protein [Vibrio marisflavi]